MKVTESKISETPDEMEREDAEDTEKRKAVKPLQQNSTQKQATSDICESPKEDSVTVSKEAPDKSQESAEEPPIAVLEPTPNKDTPAQPNAPREEKSANTPIRPPAISRKNVIPQRWSSFENGHRVPNATPKSGPSTSETRQASSDQQTHDELTSALEPLPDSGESQQPRDEQIVTAEPSTNASASQQDTENASHLADRPTLADLPATDPGALGNGHAADLPTLTTVPIASPGAHTSRQPEQESKLADRAPAQETQPEPAEALAWAKVREDEQDAEALRTQTASLDTWKLPVTPAPTPKKRTAPLDLPTTLLPSTPSVKPLEPRKRGLTRGRAALLGLLMAIVIINATVTGFSQFFGPQGWGSVFNSSDPNGGANLLTQVAQRMRQQSPTPGQATPAPSTPQQIVDTLLSSMTLDEKLGQMMMIQFTGPDYSLQLSTMVSQYKVGAVLVFSANGNIVSKSQVKGLISQMQKNAFLPLAVAIDQEGGTVDRLINLDGAQPSAASIGATGNPNNAYQQGLKDARDLASYGFNLNLAPVIDVTNVYNSQLYGRTYGNNPTIVSQMAGAYLRGLEKSGQVMGTLKHFPGLGDVSIDPHYRPPDLTRSLSGLNAIDWAPYKNLIKQGDVYAIMVTHEYVKALDSSVPSSLSPKVISVLRNQMHYQGVIMTDSLTMDSIHNYYSYGQAAAMAIEAGDDLLMGPASPNDVGSMIDGIKQAMSNGAITQKQIDDSVRRILLLKYAMGLLHL